MLKHALEQAMAEHGQIVAAMAAGRGADLGPVMGAACTISVAVAPNRMRRNRNIATIGREKCSVRGRNAGHLFCVKELSRWEAVSSFGEGKIHEAVHCYSRLFGIANARGLQ